MKTRALALIVALVFLPTALMGGMCLVSHIYSAGDDTGVVITQDVCGARAPGVVSVAQYTAAIQDATPQLTSPVPTVTPPAPGNAFAQAEPRRTEKPPQASLRA